MDSKSKKDTGLGEDLADVAEATLGIVAGAAGGPVVGAAATVTFRIISRHGKHLLAYWVNRDVNDVRESLTDIRRNERAELPPFAVVGLGRCGSHVTAQLAQMVAAASRGIAEQGTAPDGNKASVFGILNRRSPVVYPLEPMMVVGDINEAGLGEVAGVIAADEAVTGRRVLRIDYRPLAIGGAGNVPLFAEFFTRGLLALPPRGPKKSEPREKTISPWQAARSYLIDSCSTDQVSNPRLVFYIFSLGGGTGAGSAAELMRAQRYAIATSPIGDPQIYFNGVAIIPQDLRKEKNRTHLINTGRTLIQYLADLNIDITNTSEYYDAPKFTTGTAIIKEDGVERPVMPWNGLALISNDVMAQTVAGAEPHEAETAANQYISQQIFNLAASQLTASTPDGTKSAKRNFEANQLDPQDLLTGLVGPYAVCFSVAKAKTTLDLLEMDALFARAIGLPTKSEIDKATSPVIEGLSVLPVDKEQYESMLAPLRNDLVQRDGRQPGLSEESFSLLRELDFYGRCARLLFVLTQPATGHVPDASLQRLKDLVAWLCPNLNQVRYASIKGTTAHYTLSIYIEGTVVLCPDIQLAIRYYLKLCWNQRGAKTEDFRNRYRSFLEAEPPITTEQVVQWLGERERYKANIPNFDNLVNGLNQRWRSFVDEAPGVAPERKAELYNHTVESTYLSAGEVAAALKYLNYVSHFSQPERA